MAAAVAFTLKQFKIQQLSLLVTHVHISKGLSPVSFLFSLVYGDEVLQSGRSHFAISSLSIRMLYLVSNIFKCVTVD